MKVAIMEGLGISAQELAQRKKPFEGKGVVFEERGIALLSMNEDKVCRIVTDNNGAEKVIQVDPAEPFVILLPIDCGDIVMYDDQNNVVTMYDTFTGA